MSKPASHSKSMARILMPLFAILLASSASRVSAEIFLSNRLIPGEVNVEGYRNHVRLDRVSFGVDRGSLATADGERISIGVGELVPLTLTKSFDGSSAQWAQHAVSGNSIGSAEIRLTQSAGPTAPPVAFALIVLDRVFVLNYSVTADNTGRPVEDMTLAYGKISYQSLHANGDGGFDVGEQIGWDIVAGKPWEHAILLADPDTAGNENMRPIAMPDTFRILEDTLENILAVTANDRDPDGDPITISTIDSAGVPNGFGIRKAANNRDIILTPPANFFGSVKFDYRISDGALESEPAKIDVVVANVNDAPTTATDSFRTAGQAVNLVSADLLDNDEDIDGDQLTLIAVQSPTRQKGTVELSDGRLVYTPPPGFTGTDSFEYTVSDGEDRSTGTATVEVTGNIIQRVVRITLLDRTVAVIEFMGQPDQTYRVEMTERVDPSSRRWEALATVKADGDGRFEYRDNATTPRRFYRSAFLPPSE